MSSDRLKQLPAFREKRWRDNAAAAIPEPEWARELKLPPPIARLLAARGILSADQAQSFLSPRLSSLGDPFALPNMRAAVDRIWQALLRNETIAVFGDYDVDGITSTALMTRVLRAMGGRVHPFLPHRLEEGYGLGLDAFRRCVETVRPSLLVTVDCGTGSVDAVQEAARLGIDVVITDHHEPGSRTAPALAVVNPKLHADSSLHSLAGVGVAFKLCHALVKQGRLDGHPAASALDLRLFLDLVAMGTIADVVPLVGENRTFVRHGLSAINRNAQPGLRALIDVVGIERQVDVWEVSYLLAPRLNAAGRLGDAQCALELLLADEGPDLVHRARALDESNRKRRELEDQTLREAIADLDSRFDPARDFGLVVAGEGWHPGVIGIVASRLLQRFGRPTVVISINGEEARGSCRGIEGFHVVKALERCAELLDRYGGHAAAAGLQLEPSRIPKFADAFNKAAADLMDRRPPQPSIVIDGWVGLHSIDEDFLEALDRLRPFGIGNPAPTWAVRGVSLAQPPRVVGSGHLKLLLAEGGRLYDAIGWGMGPREVPEGPLDVAFQPRREWFNDVQRISLHIQDFRPATPP
ncbi:MAG: single-stranded-DNA-specific exonuclease RecJ [Kiritimatiellae bacterium]|nr:single-stranded-DNA-specific exonuclease RecJ [Kiritimatiellia bacterium]MDW8458210.1 single-stranded-DNA-specific exonuclease RecJ [Verrucomicrobiota bacterium]